MWVELDYCGLVGFNSVSVGFNVVSSAIIVAVNVVSKKTLLWVGAFSIVGRYRYITPLSALQTQILQLLGLSPTIYSGLVESPG
jgi:hypothetical protein